MRLLVAEDELIKKKGKRLWLAELLLTECVTATGCLSSAEVLCPAACGSLSLSLRSRLKENTRLQARGLKADAQCTTNSSKGNDAQPRAGN